VHLVENEVPIHGTKFRGLAESSGLTLLDDGKFHCFVEHNTDVLSYTLSSADAQPFTSDGLRSNVIKGAVFQIEIPKVTNSEQAFNQVIVVAKKMAASLNAQLVDDNKKPLTDLQIEKIRQQLKVIHATMVARGIMPGSPSSARLFN
jgi:FtsZ-interacting cell division protein ZipA